MQIQMRFLLALTEPVRFKIDFFFEKCAIKMFSNVLFLDSVSWFV